MNCMRRNIYLETLKQKDFFTVDRLNNAFFSDVFVVSEFDVLMDRPETANEKRGP